MDLSSIPIAKTVDKTLEKPASTAGNVINSLLLCVFTPILKYGVKKEAEIEAYKQQILNKVSEIPKEKLTEPPLNIIGPAIESSKFYIEVDEIKLMFANLIASSMNIDTSAFAHSSFIEIIRQLSPLDAQNIRLFLGNSKLPIVKFIITDNEFNSIDYKTHVFISNPHCTNLDLIASSITNLNRLGLVDIDYYTSYSDDSYYNKFQEHSEYTKLNSMFNSDEFKSRVNFLKKHVNINMDLPNKLDIKKGVVLLTPLGESFIKVCL